MILSPKASFLADSKAAGEWQDVVASPLFTKAAEAALLQYAVGLGGTGMDGPTLAIVGMKLEGAKGMLDALMTLGKLTKPDIDVSNDNLTPI